MRRRLRLPPAAAGIALLCFVSALALGAPSLPPAPAAEPGATPAGPDEDSNELSPRRALAAQEPSAGPTSAQPAAPSALPDTASTPAATATAAEEGEGAAEEDEEEEEAAAGASSSQGECVPGPAPPPRAQAGREKRQGAGLPPCAPSSPAVKNRGPEHAAMSPVWLLRASLAPERCGAESRSGWQGRPVSS